jgi:hypothetical protein
VSVGYGHAVPLAGPKAGAAPGRPPGPDRRSLSKVATGAPACRSPWKGDQGHGMPCPLEDRHEHPSRRGQWIPARHAYRPGMDVTGDLDHLRGNAVTLPGDRETRRVSRKA